MNDEMNINKKYPYIAILGPTASGKSSLAMKLARDLDGEIVSCDSVQVYKGFDIGSAKPSAHEQKLIKHHMLDLLEDETSYDAAQYAIHARRVILEIIERKKVPILVGGTGLYYRFLVGDKVHALPSDDTLRDELKKLDQTELFDKLSELDPKRAESIHRNDRYRLIRAVEIALASKENFSDQVEKKGASSFKPSLTILLNPERKLLHEKIQQRAQLMLAQNLVDEVRLLREKFSSDMKAMTTIGYKQVNQYLDGTLKSEEELLFRIVCATRQYAKRQITFFKKIPCDYLCKDSESEYKKIRNLF